MTKLDISVVVTTLDTEMTFTIQKKTKGKSLFDQVIHTMGLREIWYYGLSFYDDENREYWLRMDKEINRQKVKRDSSSGKIHFQLKFKFYPERAETELIQTMTIKLFYLQIKQDILNGSIYCPPEKAVLLASYALHCKYGEYDPEKHVPGFFSSDKLLPANVLSQHTLEENEWEEKIIDFYKTYRRFDKEEAMIEYLKIAQELDTYGVHFYVISNQKGTSMYLGIDTLGISVYEMNNKFTPKVNFSWSEIKKVTCSGNKFKVKLSDKKSSNFKGKCKNSKDCREIHDMCAGNYNMYVMRRSPETLEIQQMKAQRLEDRNAREAQKEQMLKEITLREKMENEQRKMNEEFQHLKEEVDKKKDELNDARQKIADLETLLADTQKVKDDLEREQEELKSMLEQLKQSHEMEEKEKETLLEEIRRKQEEVERVKEEIIEKENRSQRLKAEVNEAKELKKLNQKNPIVKTTSHSEPTTREESKTQNQENTEDIEVNKNMLLKELKTKLEATRDEEKETVQDKVYRENVKRGRDRFNTLREIRMGTIKRQIENFEAM